MRGSPPILWTAAGFAAGAAASAALGFDRTLITLLAVCVPILIWRGPKSRALPLLLFFVAGLLWGTSDRRARDGCTAAATDGAEARVAGQRTVGGQNHGRKSRKFNRDRTICAPAV